MSHNHMHWSCDQKKRKVLSSKYMLWWSLSPFIGNILGTEDGIVTLPPNFKTQSPTKLQETLNRIVHSPRRERETLNRPCCGWDKMPKDAKHESQRWPSWHVTNWPGAPKSSPCHPNLSNISDTWSPVVSYKKQWHNPSYIPCGDPWWQ